MTVWSTWGSEPGSAHGLYARRECAGCGGGVVEVTVQELRSRVGGLRDVRRHVVEVHVPLGVEPEDLLRSCRVGVECLGELWRAVGVGAAVHDQQRGDGEQRRRAQGVECHERVQGAVGDPILPMRGRAVGCGEPVAGVELVCSSPFVGLGITSMLSCRRACVGRRAVGTG